MRQPAVESNAVHSLELLLELSLAPRSGTASPAAQPWVRTLQKISREEFERLAKDANRHHVIVRGLEAAREVLHESGDAVRAGWAEQALEVERGRIENAIDKLGQVCDGLNEEGIDAIVIKSLDHWPDLGSDLDMFTSASSARVSDAMHRRFQSRIAARSWGDRLADKWNFVIPGLPESIEIHVRRLGQTGEQMPIASGLCDRAQTVERGGRRFRVASNSDRVMISTLQRMYRHFFFRVCDIADTAELADAGEIDYEDLRRRAHAAGIWDGVASYLKIVSDYLARYRGVGLPLPLFVAESAKIRGKQVSIANGYLRVPILPDSARLYRSQLVDHFRNGELRSGARLSLLPWLAAAAAVKQKLTGSDKGVW